MSVLADRRIILAVTGGIAAYKAADLASKLVQAGATLDVILTRAAEEFVRPLTFSALTRRPVYADLFAPWTEEVAGHVTLGHDAELVIVAPATANAIARLALGLAEDLLGAINLATQAPFLIAPAMEHTMWWHPATQGHVATLKARGATFVGPEEGRLASGEQGTGRLSSTETILGAARQILGRSGPLAGRSIVVSAGGTQEAIDPVRYLGNRSSGLMGFALAQAAIDRGASVCLISGPTKLSPPVGARFVAIESALELEHAVSNAVVAADALIMSAAVADFRPGTSSAAKLKKRPGQESWELPLVRNPDILAGLHRPGLVKVGFAAETEDLIANAEAKLKAKGLAMVVANDAVATIGAPDSAAILVRPDRPAEALPRMSKDDLACRILDRLVDLLRARDAAQLPR
jgi:phosphopantothenoylcysteine decarboxylase/phosphopantothenate--cysteine ligase